MVLERVSFFDRYYVAKRVCLPDLVVRCVSSSGFFLSVSCDVPELRFRSFVPEKCNFTAELRDFARLRSAAERVKKGQSPIKLAQAQAAGARRQGGLPGASLHAEDWRPPSFLKRLGLERRVWERVLRGLRGASLLA